MRLTLMEKWQKISGRSVMKARFTKFPSNAKFKKGDIIRLNFPEHNYIGLTPHKVVGWNSRKKAYVVQNLRVKDYRNAHQGLLEDSYKKVKK